MPAAATGWRRACGCLTSSARCPAASCSTRLQTSTGKRREALGIIISTQAPSDAHPLSALIDDGLLETDPTLHVQLHAAPADADPFDEEVWRACNPALGVFLDLEDFRTQAARAERIPSYLSAFKNLRLNQRVDANVRYHFRRGLDAVRFPGRP